ncbi:MAG: DUF1156 domain-containing protein, partial [Deltaproteobacteria bacterium]|nr:DUF1156 domain-containing protein [Deltaproteobacteria bacterium]
MRDNGRRLIEDFLPIKAISAEASREKSIRKGHISTLHLWWARRPLVACRAAVYGALVPASRFIPENGPDNKKQSLGRANAAKFMKRLCRYPSNSKPEVKADTECAIKEAQRHILEAHAERLTRETGKKVTVGDIEEGRASRPKVLDMFAGGGAIPLEALRLGCEAYALDLNPVAHIIELCTLVYPQKYGKPDSNVRGMTGPKNEKGETTWGGLAEEVLYWGNWVLKKVRAEIGNLYPLIPDPEGKKNGGYIQSEIGDDDVPPGYLVPVAYLWTRTVQCKNPSCGATVPLVKQTWLCKKKGGKKSPGRYVALKVIARKGEKKVRFEVVEATTEAGLGFDPSVGSKGGNATCPFCGTVADSGYVKAEGCAKRMRQQMMAIACTRPGARGKIYLSVEQTSSLLRSTSKMPVPPKEKIKRRIDELCKRTGLTVPNEPLVEKLTDQLPNYGMDTFQDIFTPHQMLCLLSFVAAMKDLEKYEHNYQGNYLKVISTYLGILVNRIASQNNAFCIYHTGRETLENPIGGHKLAMVWDFVEAAPFGRASGGVDNAIDWIISVIDSEMESIEPAIVKRGSATSLPWGNDSFDAVLTDPPYYDNIQYASLSDFFYIWMKRSIGAHYPEHFSTELTPKKNEAVASPWRHKGKDAARLNYELLMAQSFAEANRVLKPGGQMVVVYAHKTTLGWSTLVDALRRTNFEVVEAWPLDTEMKAGVVKVGKAMLASSIFLIARKREGAETGSYEEVVQPELERIVRERVDTLWKMGITGADLVIAAVGAGLRAFTRFARVEYANGEEVPAEKFLAEVEGVVLEALLERIFGLAGSGVAAVDGPSRFYVLWRYTYKATEMNAGEAIVFTYGQNVELDGRNGLSTGSRALVEKKKGKYRLYDFAERGDDEKLGMPGDGAPAPLIDALHRILWLIENEPRNLNRFLDEARPDRERLRLVAQALAG